jgi:hypothetical protein
MTLSFFLSEIDSSELTLRIPGNLRAKESRFNYTSSNRQQQHAAIYHYAAKRLCVTGIFAILIYFLCQKKNAAKRRTGQWQDNFP